MNTNFKDKKTIEQEIVATKIAINKTEELFNNYKKKVDIELNKYKKDLIYLDAALNKLVEINDIVPGDLFKKSNGQIVVVNVNFTGNFILSGLGGDVFSFYSNSSMSKVQMIGFLKDYGYEFVKNIRQNNIYN